MWRRTDKVTLVQHSIYLFLSWDHYSGTLGVLRVYIVLSVYNLDNPAELVLRAFL